MRILRSVQLGKVHLYQQSAKALHKLRDKDNCYVECWAHVYTCASKCDDGYTDKSDAVRCGGREGVASDVTGSDEQQDKERQNVTDSDAKTQTQLLNQKIAQNDADERRANVRQTHVKHDR